MTVIRRATTDDIPMILDATEQFTADAHVDAGGLVFDKKGAHEFVRIAVTNRLFVFLVAEVDGEFAGMIGAMVSPWMLGNPAQTMMEELIWYVLPKFRGRTAGIRLVSELIRIAEEKKITSLYLSNMLQVKHDSVETFYRRRGFIPMETRWVKQMGG